MNVAIDMRLKQLGVAALLTVIAESLSRELHFSFSNNIRDTVDNVKYIVDSVKQGAFREKNEDLRKFQKADVRKCHHDLAPRPRALHAV